MLGFRGSTRRARRRARAAAALVIPAVVLAALFAWRRHPAGLPPEAHDRRGSEVSSPPSASPPRPAGSSVEDGRPLPSDGATARLPPEPLAVAAAPVAGTPTVAASADAHADDDHKRALQELADEAERLRRMARYPKWSQPLDLIGDPIASAASPEPSQSAGPEGAEPVLVAYPDRTAFDAPEPVVVHAYLTRQGQAVGARSMTATVLDGIASRVLDLPLSPDGRRGLPGGAATYSGSFTPPAPDRPNAGYVILVHAITAEGQEREAPVVITYNQPYAQLTGQFRDQVEGGHLVIEAELVVQQPAAFRLEGSLYSGDGKQPLAWASATSRLAPGTTWVPLTFYGLILRERGLDGPYLLRSVSVTTETADSEAATRPLANAYLTQPYDASVFNGAAVNDPAVLAEARTLRERLARMQRESPPR